MSDRHKPYETKEVHGGVQHRYGFENGHGASVIRHEFSYGWSSGLWELAVTHGGGVLCMKTPITDDVLGWLTWADVQQHLDNIKALPALDCVRSTSQNGNLT
jgi:hypothetical protein